MHYIHLYADDVVFSIEIHNFHFLRIPIHPSLHRRFGEQANVLDDLPVSLMGRIVTIKMKVKVKEHLKAPPHHQHRCTETQQPTSSYVTRLEKTARQTTQEMGKQLWGLVHIIDDPMAKFLPCTVNNDPTRDSSNQKGKRNIKTFKPCNKQR